MVSSLQAKYVESTHNTRLKLKWSENLGYFVEVPTSAPVTEPSFFTCQVLKGHLRYKTPELNELYQMKYHATEKQRRLEVGHGDGVESRRRCSGN